MTLAFYFAHYCEEFNVRVPRSVRQIRYESCPAN